MMNGLVMYTATSFCRGSIFGC